MVIPSLLSTGRSSEDDFAAIVRIGETQHERSDSRRAQHQLRTDPPITPSVVAAPAVRRPEPVDDRGALARSRKGVGRAESAIAVEQQLPGAANAMADAKLGLASQRGRRG